MSVTWFGHVLLSLVFDDRSSIPYPSHLMMMQFSKKLSNRIAGFGRKSAELREVAIQVKDLLIKENFIQADTPYTEVMNNTLLQETLTLHLAMSLPTDVESSKYSRGHVADFDLFINGKNDTALHQFIKDKKITIESSEFMLLTKSRNSLLTFMRETKRNLVLYMQLDESPVEEKKQKTKADVHVTMEENAKTLKQLSNKRTADEIDDGFIAGKDDEDNVQEETEKDALTDITEGEKKKPKRGIDSLKAALLDAFPTLKSTGVYIVMDDDEDILYKDSFVVLPEDLVMFEL